MSSSVGNPTALPWALTNLHFSGAPFTKHTAKSHFQIAWLTHTHTHKSNSRSKNFRRSNIPLKIKQLNKLKSNKSGGNQYLLKWIHGGSFGNMDAVVLIGIGLAPSIQNHHCYRLPLGQFGVIVQLPWKSRATHLDLLLIFPKKPKKWIKKKVQNLNRWLQTISDLKQELAVCMNTETHASHTYNHNWM